MVTQNIASFDGGKVLFGFGKVAYQMNAGWIIKMWGTLAPSGTACADNAYVSGYVTMVTGLNTELSAAANCTLTSDAKVQWMFTSQSANGMGGTATTDYSSRFNVVILNGAEDSVCGKDNSGCATTVNTEPNYYGVGGA